MSARASTLSAAGTRPFWQRIALWAVVPVAITVVWHVLVVSNHWPRSIIPTPLSAFGAFFELMRDGTLPRHVGISLLRLLLGFILGVCVGLTMASAVTLWSTARILLGPTLGFLAPIPVVAWIPLLIVSLGIDGSKIALIAVGTGTLTYAYSLTGFSETRSEHIEVAQLFRKSRLRTFFSIVVPSSAYTIIGGMRVAMGLSWVLVIAGELIASSAGLGWFIWDSRNFSRPADMVAGMIAVAFLGLAADRTVQALQEWISRWRVSFQGQ